MGNYNRWDRVRASEEGKETVMGEREKECTVGRANIWKKLLELSRWTGGGSRERGNSEMNI